MAYGDTFQPAGTSRDVKVRGPLWIGIWSLVTLGFFAIYWTYVTAKDLSEYGKARGRDLGQRPGMTLLALTLGFLIIVPPIVATFRQAKRIQQAQLLAGTPPMNGWLALVLYLVVFPVFYGYEQSELNKAWAAEGGPVPVTSNEAPRLEPASQQPAGAASTTTAPEAQELSSPERPAE